MDPNAWMDRIADDVRNYFGSLDPDDDHDQELMALRDRLARDVGGIARLVTDYGAELRTLLGILKECRLRWRFGNDARAFEGVTLETLESMAPLFDRAAEMLERLEPVLLLRWADSFREFLTGVHPDADITDAPDAETIAARIKEQQHILKQLCQRVTASQEVPPTYEQQVELSEKLEQLAVVELTEYDDVIIDTSDGAAAVNTAFPKQIESAVAVLRKAAATARRTDWGATTYEAVDRSSRRAGVGRWG